VTFFEFNSKFPTEKAAIDYFFKIRYHDDLICNHCGAKVKVYKDRKRDRVCHCHNCDNTFSPFTGTIFEKTTTDIRKWFYAIHLVLNGYKGISSYQLQREIGVTHKTAWRILRLIREAMGNENMAKAFECFVEIDETYIDGKPRKTNTVTDANGDLIPKPKAKRGRGTDKTPVIGIKERDAKRVYPQVAMPNEQGQKLSGKQLLSAKMERPR
jgi:transposase-like protein